MKSKKEILKIAVPFSEITKDFTEEDKEDVKAYKKEYEVSHKVEKLVKVGEENEG